MAVSARNNEACFTPGTAQKLPACRRGSSVIVWTRVIRSARWALINSEGGRRRRLTLCNKGKKELVFPVIVAQSVTHGEHRGGRERTPTEWIPEGLRYFGLTETNLLLCLFQGPGCGFLFLSWWQGSLNVFDEPERGSDCVETGFHDPDPRGDFSQVHCRAFKPRRC